MNSSQNSAFSYKNNRPLSWPVIHANILTHSHVHGVSFFVPFCSRICSTFVPKKQSYFANLDFGSNVRFPAPILDIHIITHSHVRCVTYFFPLLSLGFPKKFPKKQSNFANPFFAQMYDFNLQFWMIELYHIKIPGIFPFLFHFCSAFVPFLFRFFCRNPNIQQKSVAFSGGQQEPVDAAFNHTRLVQQFLRL